MTTDTQPKLQRFLHFKGRTNRQIARHLGVSDDVVSRFCRGQRELQIKRLTQFAEFIGSDIETVVRALDQLRKEIRDNGNQ